MRKMKASFLQLAGILGLLLSINTSVIAHEKVVVIPLFGKKHTSCTAPDEVLSLGKCWKDRNLGATRVARNSADSAAYGDLYQWGRCGEGHQNRNSLTTPFKSVIDAPGHSFFITDSESPFDWRTPQNDNLWQGLDGVNNPCPQGFRLPTATEWTAELQSWDSNNYIESAFSSPLKLPLAGFRDSFNGVLYGAGYSGNYWSSTVRDIGSSVFYFLNGDAGVYDNFRAYGFSVRCLKD